MNSSTSFGVEISYFTKLQDKELVEDSRECLPENHRDLLHRRLNRLKWPAPTAERTIWTPCLWGFSRISVVQQAP